MKSEEDILRRARRFEEDALSTIYDTHSDELYRYAVRLLGDSHLAEECVADTFKRLLVALRDGGGPRNHVRGYLFRIAHNWVSDYFRSRHVPWVSLEKGDMDLVEEAPGPAQVMDQRSENDRVRVALAQLTPDQRQVIVLKFLEGWSNQEVAHAMRKPVGSVKSLQHRGLGALRRALAGMEEGV